MSARRLGDAVAAGLLCWSRNRARTNVTVHEVVMTMVLTVGKNTLMTILLRVGLRFRFNEGWRVFLSLPVVRSRLGGSIRGKHVSQVGQKNVSFVFTVNEVMLMRYSLTALARDRIVIMTTIVVAYFRMATTTWCPEN